MEYHVVRNAPHIRLLAMLARQWAVPGIEACRVCKIGSDFANKCALGHASERVLPFGRIGETSFSSVVPRNRCRAIWVERSGARFACGLAGQISECALLDDVAQCRLSE